MGVTSEHTAAHSGVSSEEFQERSQSEEQEYRTMLQEAIFWVTKQVLEEQRADILARAEARVKTLMELRG